VGKPIRCRTWLAVLLFFLIGLAPVRALANAAPPRYVGDAGGPLLPGHSDQVHVLHEALWFHLHPDLRFADVRAVYTLENRGPALFGQPFIFVAQSSGDDLKLAATWEGASLPVEEVDPEQFTPGELEAMEEVWTRVDTWLDPVTGEFYDPDVVAGQGGLRFYRFAVDLPAGGVGKLEVGYQHRGAYDRVRHVHPVYHYQYLLQPARGWASFGPLEIRVTLPAEINTYFASNLDFEREDGAYRVQLPGLPDENLTFAVMDRAGILFGFTQAGPYFTMAFAILMVLAAAVGVAFGWLTHRLPRQWAPLAAAAAGLLLGGLLDIVLAAYVLKAFPALREQSYGLYLEALGQGLVGAVVSTVAAVVSSRRLSQRRGAPE